jgi:cellulose biosynthesis protein BcsQ
MINIHFVMMGKGGVGKSTTAVILAQNLKAKDENFDPTNATFNTYKALHAEHINIADKDFDIDTARFDVLLEKVLSAEKQ